MVLRHIGLYDRYPPLVSSYCRLQKVGLVLVGRFQNEKIFSKLIIGLDRDRNKFRPY